MYCPACGSPEFQKLSYVYMSGLRDINSRTVGLGRSLYVGRTRGTSQSRLSQIALPPRPRRYVRVVILWLILGYAGAIALTSVMLAMHAPVLDHPPVSDTPVVQQRTLNRNTHTAQQRSQRPMQNQNAVRPLQAQNTAPPPIRWTAADQAIGYVMGAAYVVLLFVVLLRRVSRYNRDVYSKALQRWQHSFMCQKCGKIVEMAVPQTALATNG